MTIMKRISSLLRLTAQLSKTDNPPDLSKRDFLKSGFSLMLGATLLGAVGPAYGFGNQPIPLANDLQLFTDISTLLTGNKNLPTTLAKEYFTVLYKRDQNNFQSFLSKMRTVKHSNLKDTLRNELVTNSPLTSTIKNILMLWYTASFHGHTISVDAYHHTLLWQAFGATPEGVCSGATGSWQNKPLNQ